MISNSSLFIWDSKWTGLCPVFSLAILPPMPTARVWCTHWDTFFSLTLSSHACLLSLAKLRIMQYPFQKLLAQLLKLPERGKYLEGELIHVLGSFLWPTLLTMILVYQISNFELSAPCNCHNLCWSLFFHGGLCQGKSQLLFLHPESAIVPRGKAGYDSQLTFHCLALLQNLEAPSHGCFSSPVKHLNGVFRIWRQKYCLVANCFINSGLLVANVVLSHD